MSKNVIAICAGAALGFVLLAFVNRFNVMGQECFYFGTLTLATRCIKPWMYYGAWLVALLLLGWGLKSYLSSNKRI